MIYKEHKYKVGDVIKDYYSDQAVLVLGILDPGTTSSITYEGEEFYLVLEGARKCIYYKNRLTEIVSFFGPIEHWNLAI